ncbi:MAG: PD-(D/E)XK nuclease family protein [Thermoproteota archaeon]
MRVMCFEDGLAAVGRVARLRAPPVVPASAVGGWAWCPLKAWHNTTLFNAGWLDVEALDEAALKGLVLLWVSEFAKGFDRRVLIGLAVHGEKVDVKGAAEGYAAAVNLVRRGSSYLVEMLRSGVIRSPGLIDPTDFSQQLERYRAAEDIEEYFRKWAWPMIARRVRRGYFIIGVPDRVEWTDGGLRVVEVKTVGDPSYVFKKMKAYWAAKYQLGAYAWILEERWPVEEAVLEFRDRRGGIVSRQKLDPGELVEWFETEVIVNVADRLASEEPPGAHESRICKGCEYGGLYYRIVERAKILSGEA